MCSQSSGSKSGNLINTSLARYADSIVFHKVVARDLHTARLSLLPSLNEDGGSHQSQSSTPAQVLASGAALSECGSSAKVAYGSKEPFSSATIPSVAQIMVTAANWVSTLNALMIAGVCTNSNLNELHPLKASSSMLVTEDGIARLVNRLHPLKA